jgi:CHAD domain-containing protein
MKKTPSTSDLAFINDVLRRQLQVIEKSSSRFSHKDLPETVHTLRVAAFRLNFALNRFEKYFEPDRINAISKKLKHTRRILGKFRNAGLAYSSVKKNAPELKLPAAEKRTIEQSLQSRALTYRGSLMRMLRSGWYRKMLQDIKSLIPYRSVPQLERPAHPGKVGTRLVEKQFSKLRRWHKKEIKGKEFHKIRIALKRLRYSYEFLENYYQLGLSATIGQVVKLQDILGRRQDSIVAIDLLGELRSSPAVDKLIKVEKKKVRRAEKKFSRKWQKSFRKLERL